MSLPTPELKLGYELFSKLLNWAADTSTRAIRLESLYDRATKPPAKSKKPERRRRPAKRDSAPRAREAEQTPSPIPCLIK